MRPKSTHTVSGMRLSTDFDGGALAEAVQSGTDVIDCWPYLDNEYVDGSLQLASRHGKGTTRNNANFCFFFSLSGCRGRDVTLKFHIARERSKEDDVSIVYADPDFPVFSYDGNQWQRFSDKQMENTGGPFDEKIVSVRKTFSADTVWIAYQYPYTNDRVTELSGRISGSRFCEVDVVGESTEGRPIQQFTVTDPDVPLRRKKVVLFTGLQHSAEQGAGWGLEGMIDCLLSEHDLARRARETYEFKFIPIVNVDAVAEGRGRIHASGKNLNREWEKDNPLREIRTIRESLDAWQSKGHPIDVFIDFHGFSTKDGHWTAPALPADAYQGRRSEEYARFLDTIKEHLPQIQYSEHQSEGLAAGAACRRYGALSLSVDGYVYKWPSNRTPELSSFYRDRSEIWDLEEIKTAGEIFIAALTRFERS